MGKPAKTLGSPDAPCLLALKARIADCDKKTLVAWCLDTAEERFLPLYQKACPGDTRLDQTLQAARRWLSGEVKLPHVKNLILGAAHAAAREAEGLPAAQAAARAVGHTASAIHSKRHALGLAYYGAAALAYDSLGVNAGSGAYARVFEELCLRLSSGLERAVNDINREEIGIEQ